MTLRFGTDGIRGVANADLTPEVTLALGRAVARVLPVDRVLIGRDTRRSGPLLQAALASGLAAEGMEVSDVGVVPTPGLAHLSALGRHPAAMISASHNPFQDNGIKLFSAQGSKLSEAVEAAIEAEWGAVLSGPRVPPAGATRAAPVGPITVDSQALDRYADHLVASLEGRRLDGMSVVVDCAHGAASAIAPRVLSSLGARVTVLAAEPDGVNINDRCGSTHPEGLQAAVRESDADLGLAYDGDADRCLAVDGTGRLVDGDHLLALFALDLAERGRLPGRGVVVTVMTNLGFRLAMQAAGIDVVVTAVGDRHVLEAIEQRGLALGGEQSGHIIFRRLATTGDGILTGLQLADLLLRRGQSLAEAAPSAMTGLPQHLGNVAVPSRGLALLPDATAVWREVQAVEAELGATGRVLVRPSGTEPLVRVMAEAPSHDVAMAAVDRLCEVVRRELAGEPAEPRVGSRP